MAHQLTSTKSLQEQSTDLTDNKNQLNLPIHKTSIESPIYKNLTDIYNIKLLPSAKLTIDNESVCIWLKFDSNESLILRKTAKRLKLITKISSLNNQEYVNLRIPSDLKCISDKFYITDNLIQQPICGFVYFANDKFFHNIMLANREFNEPSDIDIILKGDLSYKCLVTGQRLHSQNTFSAKNTIFGWVIAGNAYVRTKINKTTGTTLHYLIKLNEE